ncbi:MAG: T9SS type A sorting domain-containing protein, partial [Crocinitomicaceae bacterium]|nr:T9SS type A sorting domain-containing protein [Crocinitomicaceae bacterium]
NPSSGTFKLISYDTDEDKAARVSITDTKGNLVFTKEIITFKGINIHNIEHNLNPGIYYLNLDLSNASRKVQKISIY